MFGTRSPAAVFETLQVCHCLLHRLPRALRGSVLCVRLRLRGVSLAGLQPGVREGEREGGRLQPPGEVGGNQRGSLDLVMRSLERGQGGAAQCERQTDRHCPGWLVCWGGCKETLGPRELASELGLSRGTHGIRLGG